jgi:hypothetical protein
LVAAPARQSHRARRVSARKTSGDGARAPLPGRGGGAVRGPEAMEAERVKHFGGRRKAPAHACSGRARGQNEPAPCPAWARHGMGWCPRQESCMHGRSALQAAADGAPIVRACNGAARRCTGGPVVSSRCFLSCPGRNHGCACRYVKWSAEVELFGAQCEGFRSGAFVDTVPGHLALLQSYTRESLSVSTLGSAILF